MKTQTPLEEQIRLLEEKLLNPEVRTSPEELAQLLAEDYLEFGSSGHSYNNQQVVQALQREAGTQFAFKDFQIRSLGPEVALATYRVVQYTKSGIKLDIPCAAQFGKLKTVGGK